MQTTIRPLQWSLFKKNASKHYLKIANDARDKKNYAEAAQNYEIYLKYNPVDAAIHIQCGHMNKETGLLQEARKHYYLAYALLPDDLDLQIQLGHLHKVLGNLDEAVIFYRRASEMDPTHAEARLQLASALDLVAHLRRSQGSELSTIKSGPPQNAIANQVMKPSVPSGTYKPHPFLGCFDSFKDGVAKGWSFDPSRPNSTLTLRAVVDGRDSGTVLCDQQRDDIAQNMSHPTGLVGFSFEVDLDCLDGQPHSIAFYYEDGNEVTVSEGIQQEFVGNMDPTHAEARLQLASALDPVAHLRRSQSSELSTIKSEPPQNAIANQVMEPSVPSGTYKSHPFLGYFDSFKDGVAKGWSFDPSRPNSTLTLRAVVDGRDTGTVLCDQLREDIVQNMSHPTGLVGFSFEVDLDCLDGQPHSIAFYYEDGNEVTVSEGIQQEFVGNIVKFNEKLGANLRGTIDGLYQGHLQGWAIRKEPRATMADGGCTIVVTCDGVFVAQARADRWRGDVANQTKADPNCGFRIKVPEAFRKPYPQTFRLHIAPENIEVDNSPYITTVLYDHLEKDFSNISAAVIRLQNETNFLRDYVARLQIIPGQTIEDYDPWARKYYSDLRERVVSSQSRTPVRSQPLISVLVPTYKPLLTDFIAAIQSVKDQTYQNWELIIVDDNSRQPQLTALIDSYCAEDSRIKAVYRTANGNISEATNSAIQAASGKWIAFFDHDDLLVDVALEVMMEEAERTHAEVLYSDEDKIDQVGYFSEPVLKPDWNHRLILGCNYVCHLLFVKADVLKRVGLLRTKYNGAQDHDLVLRLSEHVPENKIHHVSEILYHWRKTPNSTAVTIANKSYAVDAGVAAVGDHLNRIEKKSKVTSINNLTIYKVNWLYDEHPSVCIIIPFKDNILMTRLCLKQIAENTDWPNLEVILVNNWSITTEAAEFVKEFAAKPGFRVITVEEEFNYSRLNNLAAALTKADYLVLMNNDLLVKQKNWLRLLVDEALGSDNVGIVGGKLIYPNGSIQHAGLVVGPAEIAAYLHHGVSPTDYGYIGRSILSHELTAVTAACMLVKSEIFHEVGGLDEGDLKVAYNDVDLCLKVRTKGYKVIFAAEFVAEHHESYSRGNDTRPENELRFRQERQTMLDRWGETELFARDPAYNPHFAPGGRKFYDLLPL